MLLDMRVLRVRLYSLPFTFANETTPLDVECLSLLKKMDGKLEVLLAHFPAPAWATQMGSHSPFPLFNIEELKALSRGRKDSKDRLAAMWTRVDPAKFPPSGGTGQ